MANAFTDNLSTVHTCTVSISPTVSFGITPGPARYLKKTLVHARYISYCSNFSFGWAIGMVSGVASKVEVADW